MENVIQELSQLANEMEGASLSKLAANVDKVAERTLWVKKAQYVGAQGYWIRNSRCWQNCYRQKRASEPKRPVHDIWWECQAEYTEAINNDDAAWNKYADENSFVKTAENKEMVDHEEQVFRYAVAKNVDAGMPFENAVHESLQEGMERYSVALIDNADRMMHVAESLKEAGQEQMSAKAVDIANHLVHEAQTGRDKGFWGGVKDMANKVRGKKGYIANRLQNTVSVLQQRLSEYDQLVGANGQVDQTLNHTLAATFNKTMQDLQTEFTDLYASANSSGFLGASEGAKKLFNQVSGVMQQASNTQVTNQIGSGNLRKKILNQLVTSISSALPQIQQEESQAPQAAPEGAPQGEGDQEKQKGPASGGLGQSEMAQINQADAGTLVAFINAQPEAIKNQFVQKLSVPATASFNTHYTKTAAIDLNGLFNTPGLDNTTKKQFLDLVYKRVKMLMQDPEASLILKQGLGIQAAGPQAADPATDPQADPDGDGVPNATDVDDDNDGNPDAEQQQVVEEDKKSPNEGIEKLMTRELVRNPKQFGGSFVKVLQDFCSDPAKKGLCGPILLTLKDQILGMMQGAPAEEETGKRYRTQFSDQEVVASTQDLRKKVSAAKFLKKVKGVSV